jgi:hypothetical protein
MEKKLKKDYLNIHIVLGFVIISRSCLTGVQTTGRDSAVDR